MKVILMLCLLGLASAAYVVPLPYGPMYKYPAYQSVVMPYSVYTPNVKPGYIAKTPGAVHYAPLPEGLGYASHHINVKPAPGTE